jgi:hypothetical protein
MPVPYADFDVLAKAGITPREAADVPLPARENCRGDDVAVIRIR